MVSGFGTPANPAGALTLLVQGCDAGDLPTCTLLGGACEQGVGTPPDHLKAEDAYLESCTHGDKAACGRLPFTVRSQGDLPRAYALSAELCDQGVEGACVYAGNALRKGEGTPRAQGCGTRRARVEVSR